MGAVACGSCSRRSTRSCFCLLLLCGASINYCSIMGIIIIITADGTCTLRTVETIFTHADARTHGAESIDHRRDDILVGGWVRAHACSHRG